MARLRVHEIAKELNVDSKDVRDFLAKRGYDQLTSSSAVPEEAIGAVRAAFGPKKPAPETSVKTTSEKPAAPAARPAAAKPAEKPEAEKTARPAAPAGEAPAAQRPAAPARKDGAPAAEQPKKKRPAFVFRPQNSDSRFARRPAPPQPRPARPAAEPAPAKPAEAPVRPAETPVRAEQPAVKPQPQAEKPVKPAEQANVRPAAPEVKPAPALEVKPAAEVKPAPAPAAEVKPAEEKKPVRRLSPAEQAIMAARAAKEERERENARKLEEAKRTAAAFRAELAARQEAEAAARAARAASAAANPQAGRPQGGRSNGPQRPMAGNRQGQGQGQGRPGQGGFNRQGQGQGQGRPGQGGFNRQGQGQGGFNRQGQGQGRPAQGGFNRGGSSTGGFSRPGAGAAVAPAPGRGDARGSRTANNRRKDKDRQYDGSTRRQENTRNLDRSKGGRKPVQEVVQEEQIKQITLPDTITIKELADKLKQQPAAIIKMMFLKGEILTINSEIDFDKAESIAMEYDVLCEHEEKVDVIAELLKDEDDPEETLVSRPPVVCVMGHVDHGKTSILDAIRETHVTDREAGGITQHIGAYVVEINGRKITFLDTPGHEAFTAMRLRGAQSTDIAILVVAADDGVMPQTIEAISHARAADVEIVVAINKIDKPGANIDRVKQELADQGLVPEDWGGSTICVPVSAHTKEGLDDLLENLLLVADVKELKANPNRRARGLVIEAELDKGRGPVATVLIQKGTLHVGDNVAAGACYGKVRAMIDENGRRLQEAGPSVPVEILGLNDVPNAGEVFVQTATDRDARSFAETFIATNREKMIENSKMSLSVEGLMDQIKAGTLKQLNLIVKADVQGSVEAVKQSLEKLTNDEVVVKVIHGAVGNINESDVMLASASGAIIIGFNVRPDVTAKLTAERDKVEIRLYRVIYQAIEEIEALMKGMLDPVFEEKVTGHAVVRQIFKASGIGNIAGSYVTDGTIARGAQIRIHRGKDLIYEGLLASLKRFKDDVREVREGYECGLVFDKFNDFAEDDVIEAFTMVEVPR